MSRCGELSPAHPAPVSGQQAAPWQQAVTLPVHYNGQHGSALPINPSARASQVSVNVPSAVRLSYNGTSDNTNNTNNSTALNNRVLPVHEVYRSEVLAPPTHMQQPSTSVVQYSSVDSASSYRGTAVNCTVSRVRLQDQVVPQSGQFNCSSQNNPSQTMVSFFCSKIYLYSKSS